MTVATDKDNVPIVTYTGSMAEVGAELIRHSRSQIVNVVYDVGNSKFVGIVYRK